MPKKICVVAILIVFVLISTTTVFALPEASLCDPTNDITNHDCDAGLFCKPTKNGNEDQGSCEKKLTQGRECNPTDGVSNNGCDAGLFCKPTKNGNEDQGSCEKGNSFQGIFGKINPPVPLKAFLKSDPTGAGAISQFFSNFVALLFSIAAIALIFMILWGAFDWLTSGGDKEKLASAQKRIINAFIGIILFSVAFAIIRVVGTFTGFTFFKGQNIQVLDWTPLGNVGKVICPDGNTYTLSSGPFTKDPVEACKGHGT